MLRNHLIVSWRNLMKNRGFTFINVFGLAVGLTCCMLISIYLVHETSYDRYQKNAGRLYQVATVFVAQGKDDPHAESSCPLAAALRSAFPGIEATTRLAAPWFDDKTLLAVKGEGEKAFYEDKGYFADATFFRLFTYDFLEGDAIHALDNPYSLVLSEEIAHKFFGDKPALGKVIHISSSTNGEHDFRVTGVFRPMDEPSHIDARFLMSMNSGYIGDFVRTTTNLSNNNLFVTYILLRPGARASSISAKLPAFVDEYEGKDLRQAGFYKKQYLIPVPDIHLHAGMAQDVTPTGSVTYLYILASIAFFTLLIACINFMNLATARSSKRSSEVGVRKALGAGKTSLIAQFLGESLLMALMSFALALALTQLLLPAFASVTGRTFPSGVFGTAWLVPGFLGLALFTGLLAGSYPAIYLSSFKPIKVLKGKTQNSLAVASLRKALVVFQFTISVILIVASLGIARQMRYLRDTPLGFAKDQQLMIPLRSATAHMICPALEAALKADPRVINAGASYYYPGGSNPSDQLLSLQGQGSQALYDCKMNYVDFSFLQTLGLKLVAGRLFSDQFPSDSLGNIIINETAAHTFHLSPQQAIGKGLNMSFQGKTYRYTVVGVVRDFHFEDLHNLIKPYAFQVNNAPTYNYLIVHLSGTDIRGALAMVTSAWKRLDPDEPLDYSFLDQQFQKNYEADTRLSDLVGYFTAIAIAISCLGLFGLAAFSAEQRTKEIGIRKVLGAGVPGLLGLLTVDFLRLVALSLLIASPLAWFIMARWLRTFPYREPLTWTVFAYTAVATLLIAILTVGFQALKAATASPVQSLRTE